MVKKIGFVVNPIAGMGGRVGLKGTDGVVEEAVRRGATRVASGKAVEMLEAFLASSSKKDLIHWLTCSGEMGAVELQQVGITKMDIVYTSSQGDTCSDDTKNACQQFLKQGVDLIVFCGGDGTARDVFAVVGNQVPLLGIPSGVKMHSGVFGINTGATAKMLHEFVQGRLTLGDAEIMDLDEERYRKGEWNIRLFGVALGIVEPTYVQVGKTMFESVSDDEIRDELTEHIQDEMERNPGVLFLMGSGGTIDYIMRKLGLQNTLLGIDAVYQHKVVGTDVNEQQLLDLLKTYANAWVVLSPIGAQGFILGRGNLQLSPKVIRQVGVDHVVVVSTPSKLANTPVIRVDTGDKQLDQLFMEKEFLMVVIGYRLSRVVRIQTNNF